MNILITELAKYKKGDSFAIATIDGLVRFECKGTQKHSEIPIP